MSALQSEVIEGFITIRRQNNVPTFIAMPLDAIVKGTELARDILSGEIDETLADKLVHAPSNTPFEIYSYRVAAINVGTKNLTMYYLGTYNNVEESLLANT